MKNNSQLPKGYKQTEVGVIPEDWEVDPLGALTDPKRPISYGIVQTGPSIPNGVKCLRVLDVDDGRINKSDLITTTKTISDAYKRTVLRAGDLVMPLRGKVGDVALVDGDLTGCNLTRGLALIAIRSDWSATFCKQSISSIATRNRLEQSMNGSALQEIPIATLRTFMIALPPTKAEQEAIAEALSDADALIESLEQLLAKKRRLKQGAMQELLTGKKRLPGFSGEWEVKQVSEFGEIVTGGTPRTDIKGFWGEGYPWITPTDISSHRDMHTSERSLTQRGLNAIRSLPANTVLVTCIASIGKNAILKTEGGCNQQINAVIPYNSNSVEFLYYVFEASKHYLLANAGTTATSIISKAAFGELVYKIPSLPEQTAIAAILSDMDAEIAAVEARIAKARAVKQGMMQELLTGGIRLV